MLTLPHVIDFKYGLEFRVVGFDFIRSSKMQTLGMVSGRCAQKADFKSSGLVRARGASLCLGFTIRLI